MCRGVVTMQQPCMQAYSLLLIRTCHRRGVHAMGGMAAHIPIKNDPSRNAAAMDKVITQPFHMAATHTICQVPVHVAERFWQVIETDQA